MGTYLVWTLLGVAALILLLVLFTLFAKDRGTRGEPGPGDDGRAGPPPTGRRD